MTLYLGLQSPSLEAQRGFKQVLDSLSQPGKIHTQPNWQFNWPTFNNATVACLLALCDQDTPVYIDERLGSADLNRSIAFHTQSKITKQLSEAHFAFLDESVELEALQQLNIGTDISPETAALAIIQIKQLPVVSHDPNSSCNLSSQSGPSQAGQTILRLTGPGILGSRTLKTVLPVDLLTYLIEWRKGFPKGGDFLLTHQNHMIGIARTTQLEVIACM